jgi:hypothetical protein
MPAVPSIRPWVEGSTAVDGSKVVRVVGIDVAGAETAMSLGTVVVVGAVVGTVPVFGICGVMSLL